MAKSRPVQYLGLLILVLASLAIIFFPVGPKPQEQPYTIHLLAPKPWQELVGSTKDVSKEADALFAKEFSSTEHLPESLTVVPDKAGSAIGGTKATVEDRAVTQAEAEARVERVVKALGTKFRGVTRDPETDRSIAALGRQPLLTIGQVALYPPKTVNGGMAPAIKLGLDLQGGVNLVLQVRRALFVYTFDKKLGDDQDARDQFTTRVRDALATAPEESGLRGADVTLVPGVSNELEVRSQASDINQFNTQRKQIKDIVTSQIHDVKFTEARDPQFFEPKDAVGKSLGFGNDYQDKLLSETVEIIRSRVDKLGVAEPLIQKQPPDRIIVQLPGVNDPQRAVEVVGKTAQMQIVLLPQDLQPARDPNDANNTLFTDKSQKIVSPDEVLKRSEPIVKGSDILPTATTAFDETSQPAVHFELAPGAAAKFGEVTAANVNRYMPIFLDQKCISAPVIRSAITGGSGQISGGFKTMDEARSLAVLLNSGALPAPIDVVENRTVSATLGTDSLIKSLRAGLIGIAAVAVFMLAFYRLPGLLADCAVVIYCIVNLATFILIGGTLTLPGIAGFLLALAMSLDTNILVFERLKEEMMIQPSFAAALRAAFARAWTAILDSHVTTLIAAVVLFYLGTGPVKGFALTLGVGVLLSLFSAISVTRLFMWTVAFIGERNPKLFSAGLHAARAGGPTSASAPAR